MGYGLQRTPGWRRRLETYIDSVINDPHEWGKHDCGLFLANCVEAITTVNPVEGLFESYSTPQGAYKQLKRMGFDDYPSLIGDILDEIHPSGVRYGDVILLKVDGIIGWASGIVIGERSLVLMTERLGSVDTMEAHKAYRVGENL